MAKRWAHKKIRKPTAPPTRVIPDKRERLRLDPMGVDACENFFSLGEPRTGESPDSGTHLFDHEYVDPRLFTRDDPCRRNR